MGRCFMRALPVMTVRSDGANGSDEASGSASIAKGEFCPRWRKGKLATGSGDDEGSTVVGPLERGCLWKSQQARSKRYDDARSIRGDDFLEFECGVLFVDGHVIEEAVDGDWGCGRSTCLGLGAEDKGICERDWEAV